MSIPQPEALVLDHLAIHVVDLAKSVAFYEKVLLLKRIPEPFQDGLHIWYRLGPGLSLHVIGNAAPVAERPLNTHFALRVQDIAGYMEYLDSHGVAYRNYRGDGKVGLRPDGVRQIYFQDPDGYWIEVTDPIVSG